MSRYRLKKISLKIVLILLLLFNHPFFAFCEEQYVIAVIRSQDIIPYGSAFIGFQEELKKFEKEVRVEYVDFNFDEYISQPQELISKMIQTKPQLIFTIGTEATVFAKQNFKDFPIVFSMVLDPVASGIVKSFDSSQENITGVSLKISVEEQFKNLKQILPKISKIGMLYDAQKMIALKDEAERAAQNLNLSLVAVSVLSKSEVDQALEDILEKADCLWAGVDTLIYNAQSAEHILLMTLRNKIPFMAFSSHYVKAGALLALEADYEDIGRQTAELALKVLRGESAGKIPVQSPRKIQLVTNKKTAELIGVKVP